MQEIYGHQNDAQRSSEFVRLKDKLDASFNMVKMWQQEATLSAQEKFRLRKMVAELQQDIAKKNDRPPLSDIDLSKLSQENRTHVEEALWREQKLDSCMADILQIFSQLRSLNPDFDKAAEQCLADDQQHMYRRIVEMMPTSVTRFG